METSIERDFKNLRLISACNIEGMDELVNDLAKALEETSTLHKASSVDDIYERANSRTRWKKRSQKRRSNNNKHIAHLSEPSESSTNDTNIELTDNRMQQTDSDEMSHNQHTLTRLRIPTTDHTSQTIESDSVAENYAPLRPQRRRRKFKTMAIDPSPDLITNDSMNDFMHKTKHKKKRLNRGIPISSEYYLRGPAGMDEDPTRPHTSSLCETIIPGKRKRSSRSRSENYRVLDGNGRHMNVDGMDTIDTHDSSSITTSSSDSDFMGVMTNDDAREADDEQSDFFHEAGPSCGIIPLWDRMGSTTPTMEQDSTFEQILRNRAAAQGGRKCPINHIFDNPDREIRAGKRKLKERKPRYTVTRFIEDRQNWKAMQTKYASCWPNPRYPGQRGEHKRRKALGNSPISAYIDEAFEPVPECNMSGVSYRRPRKRLIGSQAQLSSDS